MSKSKYLTVENPYFSTYHYEGVTSIVAATNPSMRNWYMSNVINIRCNTKFLYYFTTPEVANYNTRFFENPHFERCAMNLKFFCNVLPQMIKNIIDNNYYIHISGIDDYYVEGKSNYKEDHFFHDTAITGYNNEKHTIQLYAYDKNWVYQTFDVPQKSVVRAIKSVIDKNKPSSCYAIKCKPDAVETDYSLMLTNLKDYLNSNMNIFPPIPESSASGIVVHNYLAMYMDRLYDGSIPYHRMDRRIFRLIYEHKKFMLERIKLMEEHYNLSSDFSTAYEPLVKSANLIRTVYAHYNKRQNNELLVYIKSLLLDIKQKEYEILSNIVAIAEEKENEESNK